MSIHDIPLAHVMHAAKQASLDRARLTDIERRWTSGVDSEREAVLTTLDKLSKGAGHALKQEYQWHGAKAAHVWEVHFLEGMDEQEVRGKISSTRKSLPKLDTWVKLNAPPAPTPVRVASFKASTGRLDAVVNITHTRTSHYEDQATTVMVTETVPVTIEWTHRKVGKTKKLVALAEVYAGYNSALTAIRAIAAELFGEDIPVRRGPPPKRPPAPKISPLTFLDAHVEALCKALNMVRVGLDGDDPRGLQGRMSSKGKVSGEFLQPLDLTDKRVNELAPENVPNRAREYGFDHTLGDGYTEHSQVAFHMAGRRMPHLTFTRRTTRSGVRYVLGALFEITR